MFETFCAFVIHTQKAATNSAVTGFRVYPFWFSFTTKIVIYSSAYPPTFFRTYSMTTANWLKRFAADFAIYGSHMIKQFYHNVIQKTRKHELPYSLKDFN